MEVQRAGEYLSILCLVIILLLHCPGRSVRTTTISFLFASETPVSDVLIQQLNKQDKEGEKGVS